MASLTHNNTLQWTFYPLRFFDVAKNAHASNATEFKQ